MAHILKSTFSSVISWKKVLYLIQITLKLLILSQNWFRCRLVAEQATSSPPQILSNFLIILIIILWHTFIAALMCQAWWRHQMETFSALLALCGESTAHRWIPRTKASDAELWCFLWSAPWINGSVNNREAGDLRRHRAPYDVIVMGWIFISIIRKLCFDYRRADRAVTTDHWLHALQKDQCHRAVPMFRQSRQQSTHGLLLHW